MGKHIGQPEQSAFWSSEMSHDLSVWNDRPVLVTGHTGFKGSWLSLYLSRLGARVSGYSYDPRPTGLFMAASVSELLEFDVRGDVRDLAALTQTVREVRPSMIFHLAAQPIVRVSFLEPIETMTTNVIGTANVLQAANVVDDVRGVVVVTSDKVYDPYRVTGPYSEEHCLGGRDPYSASKAAAELVTRSMRESILRDGLRVATARAGNVIGGGDDSEDRLLPDLIRCFEADESCPIRHPAAIRPWQHVLDPLRGYVILAETLIAGDGVGEWNFGPRPGSDLTVAEVADGAAIMWGPSARWHDSGSRDARETVDLRLDSTKALRDLNWRCRLAQMDAVQWTVEWEKSVAEGACPRQVSLDQLDGFLQMIHADAT